MNIATAIQTIEDNSYFVAYVTVGGSEHLDIHSENGEFVSCIHTDETDRFLDTLG